MIGQLLILGVTLGLDNFRTAILLGALRLTRRHAVQVALVFGFWDLMAPLVGILAGDVFAEKIGSSADVIGATVLGLFGLYLLVQAWRNPAPEEMDQRWALFGLPLPLRIDNVVAGTGRGLHAYSPWVAPPLFGITTFFMTFIGLAVGRVAARFIRIRADLLTGIALIVMAVALLLGFGGD